MSYDKKDGVYEFKVPVRKLPSWYYNALLRFNEQVSDRKGLQRIIEGLRPKRGVSKD